MVFEAAYLESLGCFKKIDNTENFILMYLLAVKHGLDMTSKGPTIV